MTKRNVCLVGSSGTVGMSLAKRLADDERIQVFGIGRSAPAELAQSLIDTSDLVVLCLPEEATREWVARLPAGARVLDASPVHRLEPGWVYGLPELGPEQPQRIREALRVANPGCYATGAVLALRPLADLLADYPVAVFGMGGASTGGNRMLQAAQESPLGVRLYGLNLEHRHLDEITRFAGLARRPSFMPAVADYPQGTMVQVPLDLELLGQSLQAVRERYVQAYQGTAVEVVVEEGPRKFVSAGELANTDGARLRILADATEQRVLVVVTFDNLGKGAAGAAATNIALMLGL